MVGSVWSSHNSYADYSLYERKGSESKTQEGHAEAASGAIGVGAASAQKAPVAEAAKNFNVSLAGNNVNASLVASQLALSAGSAASGVAVLAQEGEEGSLDAAINAVRTAGRPSVGGGGGAGGSKEEEEDETITIYKTIVLPDGSKLLQIITKQPDGTVKTTTTKLPGLDKKQGDTEKKVVDAVPQQDDENGEAGEDQVGASAMDMVARNAGMKED